MARHIHIHIGDVLEGGQSQTALHHNIATEIAAGKPRNQAVAIAYAKQREAKDEAPCSCSGRKETFYGGTE